MGFAFGLTTPEGLEHAVTEGLRAKIKAVRRQVSDAEFDEIVAGVD